MERFDFDPKTTFVLVLMFALIVGGGVSAYATGVFSDSTYSKYEVKRQVVERHNPGTCFGMPTVITRDKMESYIQSNSRLANKVKSDFAINSKEELYKRMKQIEQVTTLEKLGSTVRYKVRDGSCCNIKTHYSTYNVDTDSFSSIKTQMKSVPC